MTNLSKTRKHALGGTPSGRDHASLLALIDGYKINNFV